MQVHLTTCSRQKNAPELQGDFVEVFFVDQSKKIVSTGDQWTELGQQQEIDCECRVKLSRTIEQEDIKEKITSWRRESSVKRMTEK